MVLPKQVQKTLERLNEAGFEAFLVGGCVRDDLLGICPKDYDITTSAKPEEVHRVFADEKIVDVGLKHGTVEIVYPNQCLEVTTYRIDGTYRDARHPDTVHFTTSLKEDLSRRDFTINAMAYSKATGVVDLFGGQKDLNEGLIRCVGNPKLRFSEDALRMVRAIRLASVLDFQIEEETKQAIFAKKHLLSLVAPERLGAEFVKLLCGKAAGQILCEYAEIIGDLILQPFCCTDFRWLNHLPSTPVLRIAAFLHTIQKTEHSVVSDILDHLRVDRHTKERVLRLLNWYDYDLETTKICIKPLLAELTPEGFFDLLILKQAENKEKWEKYEKIKNIGQQILDCKECYRLSDLAVNGHDLIESGILPGKHLGEILFKLLSGVIAEEYENEKEILLEQADKIIKKEVR